MDTKDVSDQTGPVRDGGDDAPATAIPPTREAIQTWLTARLAERLGLPAETLDIREPFAAYGLDSVESAGLSGDLEDWLDRRLSPTVVWEYPSIEALARYLADDSVSTPAQEPAPAPMAAVASAEHTLDAQAIAIIGLGCRFPGAAGPEAFWHLLRDGVDAIGDIPADRWDAQELYDANPGTPGKMTTHWGGFLDQVDRFDAQFFGIAPREAAAMDPQQRLLLEVAWEALEDAGQSVERLAGSQTGVFVGISSNDYGQMQLDDLEHISAYAGIGSALSIAANRLSYAFDLRGPSLAIDTACSSSLVAVHLACRSLVSGESTLALAGGVNVILTPGVTINFSQAGAMAPDGRCKAFDARANGYVRSEGAGIVVLKPLALALRDGDPIYAVIRGSAVNQDGRSNGLMAPNPQAQEALLREAYRQARVSPGAIDYVEAHGTGTFLGDPMEAQALGAVLAIDRPAGSYCAIGSVKTNIGHLEAAAGIAGLIKVALSLKHGELPPSLHFQEPNPHIPFDALAVRVQQTLGPWPEKPGPRLAGVSSFGFGGTNAHVVVQEAPVIPLIAGADGESSAEEVHLLPLSARSPEALQATARAFQDYLRDDGDGALATLRDMCYTASARRSHHDYRIACVGGSRHELIASLDTFLRGELGAGVASGRRIVDHRHKIVFVLPGQGSQSAGMARELLTHEPVFRAALEACDQVMRQYVEWSLLAKLTAEGAEQRLDEIDVIQPVLCAIQIGLAALWRSWGITPDAVVGQSMGEVAAAHVAGALNLDDALRIICRRSQLLKRVAGQGAMAVVGLSLEQARVALAGYEDRVAIAVSNSPTSTVLSGEAEALRDLMRTLERQEVFCRLIQVDVASHSPQMDPLLDELRHALEGLQPGSAAVPLYSTVEGGLCNGSQLDEAYWARNLREPVLFAPVVRQLRESGHDVFMELSPHPILLSTVQQVLQHLRQVGICLPSLRRGERERSVMRETLGALFALGAPVDWRALYPFGGHCVPLPPYPWQRERYWLAASAASGGPRGKRFAGSESHEPAHPLLGRHWQSAMHPDTHFWELALHADPAALWHHGRGETTIQVPDEIYAEVALAAATEAFGVPSCTIDQVIVREPLVLAAPGVSGGQLILSPVIPGIVAFQFFTLPEQAAQSSTWTLHVAGTLHVGSHGRAAAAPATTAASADPAGAAHVRDVLLHAPPAERHSIAESYLSQQIGQVLGHVGSTRMTVDVHQSLSALGLDSLMAVELRNRLQADLGVVVPLKDLLQDASIARLVGQVVDQVASESSDRALIARTASDLSQAVYPLSHGQRALWFLHQLAPESAAYNVTTSVRIWSSLDVAALRGALQSLADRHSTLRTTFTTKGGEPMQQTHKHLAIGFRVEDAAAWGEAALDVALSEEIHRPFDLEHGPLLRAAVFARAPQDHVLCITVHHIVVDLWSLGILMNELRVLYQAATTGTPASLDQAATTGTPASLAAPTLEYADFVRWQEEMLAGPGGERLWTYWERQLAGAKVALDLPIDHPRPPVQTYRGQGLHFTVPAELTHRLKALAQTQGVTLYTLLLAAFQVLMHRYTGQDDILVGSPAAGRTRMELEGLIGYLVNPLVLRTDFAGDPLFTTLLHQVSETALAALEHQDLPFPLLVERLRLPRDPSRSPLFQVMFVYDNAQRHEQLAAFVPGDSGVRQAWGDLEVETLTPEQRATQFDLTLTVMEAGDTLTATLEGNTDLFEPVTIARMAAHYQTLLEGILATPEERVSRLPLLAPAERQRMLVEWNAPLVSVHQLFEAQVERTPDAVAVSFGDGLLTYRELNRRANQWANRLQALGVGPEVLVGLCVERSLEMIVGILGTLKAGGAYVPLDPEYPEERLAFMLEDSHVSVLLTQSRLQERLPAYTGHLLCLDVESEIAGLEGTQNPASGVAGEHLAYVIYTSGSTGTPKGVQIEHRSLLSSTNARMAYYREPVTSFLLLSSVAFDSSVAGIFWALCEGGTLVLPPSHFERDLARLQRLIASQRVSHMLCLPALYGLLLEQPDLESLAALRTVIVAGESCPWELAERHRALIPAVVLYNEYGPTEATVWCSVYRVGAQQPTTCVPIGRPIAGMRLFVLDAQLQLVPIGVPGELYIGGIGLARGYLNQPELTAERFIPSSFSGEVGARLYRTGDLARYLSDGNIEFLGRRDQQVKIRGFRVELGEIETALLQHPTIREVAVLTTEDRVGDRRLVAYVAPRQEKTVAVSELRSYLRTRLPGYMVPAAFTALESLPRTPNGKVDRRALPAPQRGSADRATPLIDPRDDLELQLAQIFENVLDVTPIGINDDFFDLGGHSLLAVRLMAQLREQFGQALPLSALLQSGTVEALAMLLRQEASALTWSPLVKIQPLGAQRPLFFVHPVGGNVLCYALLARHLGQDQPLYGLQAPGLFGERAPHTRIEDMATEYIAVMRGVQPHGPYLLGGWSFGGVVAFEMAQQLHRAGQDVALLALLDSSAPTPETGYGAQDTRLLAEFAASLRLPVAYGDLEQLGQDQQLAYILDKARAANLVPADARSALMAALLRVYESNSRSCQNYTPDVYPNQITLMRASESLVASSESEGSADPDDPTLGWRDLSTVPVENHAVPGTHFTLLAEPHVGVVAEQLRQCLATAHKGRADVRGLGALQFEHMTSM